MLFRSPGLPTVASAGLPGYEAVSIVGLFAPAKTPEAVVARLNQEIVRVLGRAEVKERFLSSGVETVGSTPAQFDKWIRGETERWGKLIRAQKITLE